VIKRYWSKPASLNNFFLSTYYLGTINVMSQLTNITSSSPKSETPSKPSEAQKRMELAKQAALADQAHKKENTQKALTLKQSKALEETLAPLQSELDKPLNEQNPKALMDASSAVANLYLETGKTNNPEIADIRRDARASLIDTHKTLSLFPASGDKQSDTALIQHLSALDQALEKGQILSDHHIRTDGQFGIHDVTLFIQDTIDGYGQEIVAGFRALPELGKITVSNAIETAKVPLTEPELLPEIAKLYSDDIKAAFPDNSKQVAGSLSDRADALSAAYRKDASKDVKSPSLTLENDAENHTQALKSDAEANPIDSSTTVIADNVIATVSNALGNLGTRKLEAKQDLEFAKNYDIAQNSFALSEVLDDKAATYAGVTAIGLSVLLDPTDLIVPSPGAYPTTLARNIANQTAGEALESATQIAARQVSDDIFQVTPWNDITWNNLGTKAGPAEQLAKAVREEGGNLWAAIQETVSGNSGLTPASANNAPLGEASLNASAVNPPSPKDNVLYSKGANAGGDVPHSYSAIQDPNGLLYAARSQDADTAEAFIQNSNPGQEITVGRENSDVILSERLVSRTHATITPQADGTYLIKDSGSSNGTVIRRADGTKIELQAGKDYSASPDDIVQFGKSDYNKTTIQLPDNINRSKISEQKVINNGNSSGSYPSIQDPNGLLYTARSQDADTAEAFIQNSNPGQEITVGRENSDVILSERLVSRTHATITPQADGTYLIKDLGSSNGTVIRKTDGTKIELQAGETYSASSGDIIQFSKVDDHNVTIQLPENTKALQNRITNREPTVGPDGIPLLADGYEPMRVPESQLDTRKNGLA
jgi:pSer/pThr/pTyr-binding forkhead associated (FHA) protein